MDYLMYGEATNLFGREMGRGWEQGMNSNELDSLDD